jgi:uncharacterized protein (DUF4415 family)
MAKPPNRYRPNDPRQAAEAAFKKATAKAPEPTPQKKVALPPGRETVSLRIDRDVLEHFQKDGPGWQDRINQALRKASGLLPEGPRDEGLRPDELTSENDQ